MCVAMEISLTGSCIPGLFPYFLYVTVFWKTDYLLIRIEIHLLPVHDRHIHALSRNTKH